MSANEAKTQPRITYFYDALCGWCFGFAPAFDEFYERHQGDFDFEVISGGLFGDNPDKMPIGRVNDAAPHIKAGAYKTVEERTGVRFGTAFLDDVFAEGTITLDSMYPAVAMAIVKELAPQRIVEFSKMLNDAVYIDGFDPIDAVAYGPYAARIGLDAEDFAERMGDSRYRVQAQAEFDAFQASDATVFPTLVIESEQGRSVLAEGDASISTLETRLAEHLA